MGNSIGMEAIIESFAVSARSAVTLEIKPLRTLRTQRESWGISIGMEAIIESFAISACFAVNKIEPRRALRTQRGEGDSVNMKTVTEKEIVIGHSFGLKIER